LYVFDDHVTHLKQDPLLDFGDLHPGPDGIGNGIRMPTTMIISLALLAGLLAGLALSTLYYRERAREQRVADLEKRVLILQENPRRRTEDRILDALAVICDLEVETETHKLRLNQARRILFDAKSKRPHSDEPAGPRPRAR
jgi:hypothetical protein